MRCFRGYFLDPETFQQSEHQRFSTEKKEKEHNKWQQKPSATEAAVSGRLPDPVTEIHSLSLLEPDWSNQGNSPPPPATPPPLSSSSDVTSSTVASSELTVSGVASSQLSEDVVDYLACDLVTASKSKEQFAHKAGGLEVSEGGDGDDDNATLIRPLDKSLVGKSSTSVISVIEKASGRSVAIMRNAN